MLVDYVWREERKILFLLTFNNDFHFQGLGPRLRGETPQFDLCRVSARPVTDISISFGLQLLPVQKDYQHGNLVPT